MKKILLSFLTPILAMQFSHAQALLWEISGNGLATPSYLFGTVHVKDKRVFDFNDSLPVVMQNVKQVAMELDLDDTETLVEMSNGLLIPEGKTLHDIISKQAYSKLESLLKKELNMEMTYFDMMVPFGVMTALMQKQMPKDEPFAMDMMITAQAGFINKPVLGLETPQEQLKAIGEQSSEDILAFCDEYKDMNAEIDKLIIAYLSADLEEIGKLTEEQTQGEEAFIKRLLTDRNIIMAERMDTMIQNNSTLTCIGAGHLDGEKGVLKLLTAKGYSLRPIISKKSRWPNWTPTVVWTPIDVEGILEIEFPEAPKKQVQNLPSELGELEFVIYMHQPSPGNSLNVLYNASVIKYPEEFTLPDSEIATFYDQSQEGAITNSGGKLETAQDITMYGLPARELVISFQEGVAYITMHICLIGNDLIMLQCIAMAENKNNEDQKRFLTSGKLKQ